MLLDDRVRSHPKYVKAGAEACWLLTCATMWSREQLTNGFIPAEVLGTLWSAFPPAKARRLAQQLVDAKVQPEGEGLFVAVPGGYQIHDFSDFNDTKAEVLAKRQAEKDRKAAWRLSRRSPSDGPVGVPSLSQWDKSGTSDRVPLGQSRPAYAYPRDGVGVGTDLALGEGPEGEPEGEARDPAACLLEEWPSRCAHWTGRPHARLDGARYEPDAQALTDAYPLARLWAMLEALVTSPHHGLTVTPKTLRTLAPELDGHLDTRPGVAFRAPKAAAQGPATADAAPDPSTAWGWMFQALHEQIPSYQFAQWIAPLRCTEDDGRTVSLTAPDADHARYVQKHYAKPLATVAKAADRTLSFDVALEEALS